MDAPPPPGPEVLRWLTQPCPGAWDFGSCTWRPWLERHRSRAWGARHGCVGHPWWVLSAHLTAQLAKFQTPITRITFPTCRAHYPGGSERVHTSVASPFHAAFPDRRAVRHPLHDFTFEACSDFTRVTARWIAQPPKATFVTRLRSGQLPNRPARQLPDQPTTLWVVPSSTGVPRLRGALSA